MQPQLDPEHEGKVIIMENLMRNLKKLDKIRSLFSILGGIIAGVLYLTGIYGLYVYVGMSLLVNLLLYAKMGFDCKKYVSKSFFAFFMSDLQKNAMSFILFWTLTYGLIYIY